MSDPHATEKPTPKRLDDARAEGRVARSSSLSAATHLLAIVIVLTAAGSSLLRQLLSMLRSTLDPSRWGATASSAASQLPAHLTQLPLPTLACVWCLAVIGGLLQVGPMLSFRALEPRARRSSAGGILEAALQLTAVGVAGYLLIDTVLTHARDSFAAIGRSPRVMAMLALVTLRTLIVQLAAVGFAVGAIDLLLKRSRLRESLRMTRAEVEQERRETEGDPRWRKLRREGA